MSIKEIDGKTFNEFTNNHVLRNFFQTHEYGSLMQKSDFQVMYIGAYEKDSIVAASLILHKTIGPNMKYGYAPRGFIVDYYDDELLKKFAKKVKDFFFMKGFAFIKINPEITYSIIDFDNKTKNINGKNKKLIDTLKSLGFVKLKDNLYFESVLPKYTPVINLKNYNMEDLDEDLIEDVHECERNGVKITKGTEEDLEKFYEFVKNKKNKTLAYYKYFYNSFKDSDMVDLLLLELDYELYMKFLQKQYVYETAKNDEINKYFSENTNSVDAYNEKMESDKIVNKIKTDIQTVNKKVEEVIKNEIVGGAFIVRHAGRVTIIITGNSKVYENLPLKEYMFYKIIEMYKNAGYKFIDLYGITADYTDKNPYKKLNEFKLKFKPTVYEYIGEFDFIINKAFHQLLWSTNKIQKEFYKPTIKKS